MTQLRRASMMLFLALLLAACGSVATPIWQTPEATPTTAASATAPILPTRNITAAEVQPTSTPLPPTVTAMPLPPTVAPTSTPEHEMHATDAPTTSTGSGGPRDPISVLVSMSDPAHGQELFNTYFDLAGYMCATCHRVDTTEKLLGPGLLGIGGRGASADAHAGHAAPEEAPERYIFNSITNPDLFVVEGFPNNLMPEVYAEIFAEQDIYDLIAYLMTLE